MTIAANQRSYYDYVGSGQPTGGATTVSYTYGSRFLKSSDLRVLWLNADGSLKYPNLVLGIDYTVTGEGNPDGGTVTFLDRSGALGSGWVFPLAPEKVIIYSRPAIEQEADLTASASYDVESVENSLDRLVLIAQRLNFLIGRSIHLSDTDDQIVSTEIPIIKAGDILHWEVDPDVTDGFRLGSYTFSSSHGMGAGVSGLEAEVIAIRSDLSQLEDDTRSLNRVVSTNTVKIGDNATNISTNTGNISTNTGNISTNTTEIASVKRVADKGAIVGQFTVDKGGNTLEAVSDNGTTQEISLPGITVRDDATVRGTAAEVKEVNFKGAGVTVSQVNATEVDVTIPGGTGGTSGITVADEATTLGAVGTVDKLDFKGDNVSATRSGNTVDIDVTTPAQIETNRVAIGNNTNDITTNRNEIAGVKSTADSAKSTAEAAVVANTGVSVNKSNNTLTVTAANTDASTVNLPGLTVEEEGTTVGLANNVTKVNYTGAGVTASRVADDEVEVNIPGGGGGGSGITGITVAEEDNNLGTSNTVTKLAFKGDGVEATRASSSNTVDVTVDKFKLTDHQKEVFNAFSSSGWENAGSDAATNGWVYGGLNSADYTYAQATAFTTPTDLFVQSWPHGRFIGDSNNRFLVRLPKGLDHLVARGLFRLETSQSGDEGSRTPDEVTLSNTTKWVKVTGTDADATWRYYSVNAMSPAGASVRVQQFDEFTFEPNRIELSTLDLDDMPDAAAQTAAGNTDKLVGYKASDKIYELLDMPDTSLEYRKIQNNLSVRSSEERYLPDSGSISNRNDILSVLPQSASNGYRFLSPVSASISGASTPAGISSVTIIRASANMYTSGTLVVTGAVNIQHGSRLVLDMIVPGPPRAIKRSTYFIGESTSANTYTLTLTSAAASPLDGFTWYKGWIQTPDGRLTGGTAVTPSIALPFEEFIVRDAQIDPARFREIVHFFNNPNNSISLGNFNDFSLQIDNGVYDPDNLTNPRGIALNPRGDGDLEYPTGNWFNLINKIALTNVRTSGADALVDIDIELDRKAYEEDVLPLNGLTNHQGRLVIGLQIPTSTALNDVRHLTVGLHAINATGFGPNTVDFRNRNVRITGYGALNISGTKTLNLAFYKTTTGGSGRGNQINVKPGTAFRTTSKWGISPIYSTSGNLDSASSTASPAHNVLTELYSGVTGMSLATTNGAQRQSLTGFSPNFRLTDTDVGIILSSTDWSIPSHSTVQLSLRSETHVVDQTFLSTLRTSVAYDGSADTGVEISKAELWTGSGVSSPVKIGDISLYIAKNSANDVGFYFSFAPATPGYNTAGQIYCNFSASLVRSDVPPSPTLTLTTKGRLVARSTALPTALVAKRTNLGPHPGQGNNYIYRWTNLATGYRDTDEPAGSNTFVDMLLTPPANPPSDAVDGFLIVSKVGANTIQTVALPWGPGTLTEENPNIDYAYTTLFFNGGVFAGNHLEVRRIVVRYQIKGEGYPEITLIGDGTILPANSTVEVYEKGVFAL